MPLEDDLPSSQLKWFFELILHKYRYYTLILLVLFLVFGIGILVYKGLFTSEKGGVEVLEATNSGEVKGVDEKALVVEVSGEVQKPGVYEFSQDSRIDDALEKAGGLTEFADNEWIAKTLNRAAKLVDGQKLYIPAQSISQEITEEESSNQSQSLTAKEMTTTVQIMDSRTIISNPQNTLVNVNVASLSELDKLPGIGPVYGQNIIDHRPYSDINELVSKGALKKHVFEKIKDKISVY